jgi:hypothetical protein
MTDWQIRRRLEVAAERADRMKAAREGRAEPATPMPAADPFAAGLPPRGEFVAALVGAGTPPAAAHAMYDRMLRERDAAS